MAGKNFSQHVMLTQDFHRRLALHLPGFPFIQEEASPREGKTGDLEGDLETDGERQREQDITKIPSRKEQNPS